MLPTGIIIAPDKILQTTSCKCVSIKCKINKWSRVSADLNSSEFCGCQECDNQSDMHTNGNETEDDNNDDDESGTEDELLLFI